MSQKPALSKFDVQFSREPLVQGGLGVLISTPSPEKESLLGPTVREKIAYQILKEDCFFGPPFTRVSVTRTEVSP